ncbi:MULTISPECIES: VIT1/CCC1 transporter family protein [unclassified Halorhabdus]|uniref:VIT1/CCC1 transporter family protein n=1 Tax=unclassified Halorhabdus TaxID=2621901 RepID=UPI0023DA56EF|nr:MULTISPECIES: VIT1/CCC1 transporter family protein [unclassified Halorhabdus]WEL17627.1 Putative Fe2 /Mn2 transporter, VIT1/CCC1 family [Halorhabdus sp. SVX81]WEL21506.1 Putative Fe2 /Mn2 transporter, VIT1/CCC1 family [Halorhabdus sp. BNX81]
MSSRLADLRELLEDEDVRSISRRYFISNGFDGTLTTIGIIVGSFLGGSQSSMEIVRVVAGGTVGLAASGVWSVWEIERAEKLAELKAVEEKMLTGLEGTELHERKGDARKVNAAMSGLGPTIGMLLPIIPYFFVGVTLSMLWATVIGVLIGVSLLFVFGAYMGNLSEQNWVIAGLRTGLVGLVVGGINIILPG